MKHVPTTARVRADHVARAQKTAQRAVDMARAGEGLIADGNGGFGADHIRTAGALALTSIASSLAYFASADLADAQVEEGQA